MLRQTEIWIHIERLRQTEILTDIVIETYRDIETAAEADREYETCREIETRKEIKAN